MEKIADLDEETTVKFQVADMDRKDLKEVTDTWTTNKLPPWLNKALLGIGGTVVGGIIMAWIMVHYFAAAIGHH